MNVSNKNFDDLQKKFNKKIDVNNDYKFDDNFVKLQNIMYEMLMFLQNKHDETNKKK